MLPFRPRPRPGPVAAIAKQAYAEGRTVREVAYEESGLGREQVDDALHPHRQTVAGTGAG